MHNAPDTEKMAYCIYSYNRLVKLLPNLKQMQYPKALLEGRFENRAGAPAWMALQCKLYSNPVGNKAVQEVAAGRVLQHAKYGAVVTNSTFTPSAWELAASNGIHLLHHTDLAQLERIVGSDPLIRRFDHEMLENSRTEFQSISQQESEVTKAVPERDHTQFENYPETRKSPSTFPDSVDDTSSVDNANRKEPKDRRHLILGSLCLFGATGFYLMMSRSSSVPSRPHTSNSTATSSRRLSNERSPSFGLRPAGPSVPSIAASRSPSNAQSAADSSSGSSDTAKVSVSIGECNSGKMVSCTNLGTFYRMGWGVTKDVSRAAALYKKGCDGGDANGCSLLKLIEAP